MNSLVCTPENLCNVVRHAEAEHKRKRDVMKRREEIAMGAMAEEMKRSESPENLAHGIFKMLVSSMVTSSPTGRFVTSGGYREHLEAAALGHATTQMARAQKIERALEPCAWDFFFAPYCCGIVETADARVGDLTKTERELLQARAFQGDKLPEDGAMGARGHDALRPQTPPQWARFKHLRPDECGFDVQMGSLDRARYTYHVMLEDRETLQRRAEEHPDDWIPENVAMCATANQWPGEQRSFANEENQYCRYYVVYVPGGRIKGKDPEPHQPGVVYTIAGHFTGGNGSSSITGLEIRQPYYWTGHPDGLHFFEGNYTTGADSHFLSLLAANEDSLAHLESVSASLHQRIRDHKVVVAYDSTSEEAAQKLAKAPNGTWVSVPGLDQGSGAIQTIETSAPTPVEFTTYDRMRFNVGLALGIDSQGLGVANPDATATAVGVAASSTRTQVEYLLGRWNRFVGAAFERLAFEAAVNSSVVIRLDEDARESALRTQLQPIAAQGILSQDGIEAVVQDQKRRPMLFSGGAFAGPGNEFNWHNLQLIVEPHSMEGAFGEAEIIRQSQWNQALAFLGDVMVRQPHIRWADRVRATGRAMGMTDAEMAVDLEKAMAVAQMQIASGAPSAMTTESAPRMQGGGPAVTNGSGMQRGPRLEA